MTVLSAQTIQGLCLPDEGPAMISPYSARTLHETSGCSYGQSACGYDVRLDQDVELFTDARGPRVDQTFTLASTMEKFHMPRNGVGFVHDKSTWARLGVAVQNTVIEPGWVGYLTLGITLHSDRRIVLPRGTPIAQVVFHFLDQPTAAPYPDDGKYQNQERGPQAARRGDTLHTRNHGT